VVNLKVAGSNPAPAPNLKPGDGRSARGSFLCGSSSIKGETIANTLPAFTEPFGDEEHPSRPAFRRPNPPAP
jgi:hypothetical protein